MNTETTWKQDIKNPEIYKHVPSWIFGVILVWLGYLIYSMFATPLQTLLVFAFIGFTIIVGSIAKKVIIEKLEALDKKQTL